MTSGLTGLATKLTLAGLGLLLLGVTLAKVASTLPQLDDAGYPDSYILYDVRRYVATGTIYKDLSAPPYNPTVYGPLLYWTLGKVVGGTNQFLGPRLLVLAAWASCVLLVGYLTFILVRMTTQPPLTDPFILGLQVKTGSDSYGRFFEPLHRGEFQLVVTSLNAEEWRGIPHVLPEMNAALSGAYRPYCVYGGAVFYLPLREEGSPLAGELIGIGCRPVTQ